MQNELQGPEDNRSCGTDVTSTHWAAASPSAGRTCSRACRHCCRSARAWGVRPLSAMALARVGMRRIQDARSATPRNAQGGRTAAREEDTQIARGPALTGAEPLLAFGWMTRMCALEKQWANPCAEPTQLCRRCSVCIFKRVKTLIGRLLWTPFNETLFSSESLFPDFEKILICLNPYYAHYEDRWIEWINWITKYKKMKIKSTNLSKISLPQTIK